MATRRALQDDAFVLHRYDWSETSLILEILTRGHGRMALIAKGAKRPSSNFRPVLLPLQPLHLSFGGDGEIKTLKAAEWTGGHVMPTGEALLSGYYLNELLLRLLAREDPHAGLFDAYRAVVEVLAGTHGAAQAVTQAASLRAFELVLLRETGHLPSLSSETATIAPLAPQAAYTLVPEQGLRAANTGEAALRGAEWTAVQRALEGRAAFAELFRHIATMEPGANAFLRAQLRVLLNYHCGVTTLRTRQMMRELQSL